MEERQCVLGYSALCSHVALFDPIFGNLDPAKYLIIFLPIVGRLPCEHAVQNHSARPNIAFAVSYLVTQDLWGHIVGGSVLLGELVSLLPLDLVLLLELGSQTKVDQFDVDAATLLSLEDNVFWLDISMRNASVVQVADNYKQLPDDILCLLLVDLLLLPDEAVQIATSVELRYYK